MATAFRALWRYFLRGGARAGIAVPTLLLGGTRDRIGFMQERAEALLPQAQRLVLEDATDFVAEQEPARFADTLRAFLLKAA